ncbi:MAG: ATP-binding protein [Gammaproteobacteria bacterium]|nr:ATP-binding protein [Gammaproteobacteria bacterium]
MIARKLESALRKLASHYPAVAVTGPRQSGKTTLCRTTFPDLPYVSLEAPDTRAFALEDPRGFLAEHRAGAIFDEAQQTPELFSYLQVEVDENPQPGRFILTGSHNLGLTQAVAQSLAGRSGNLTLLPPSLSELRAFPNAPDDLYDLLWRGAYPRPYDRDIPPHQWLADYTANYLQRDVRQIVNVGDLNTFTTFLRLCAGRSAQEINLSALGGDAGVSHNTARAWLSVLEASYVIHRLPAWHINIRKQLVKAPKLHFFDSGLLCYLLGIREPDQLRLHPLRGAIFESWVVSEIYKGHVHEGIEPRLYHYRESRGLEIDLIVDHGTQLDAIEIKSGETLASGFFDNPKRFEERLKSLAHSPPVNKQIVYGGSPSMRRNDTQARSWLDLGEMHTGAS